MSEAPIVLSALTAHTNNLHRQGISNSSEETALASRSQLQLPTNRDSRSVPQTQIQGAAQPELCCGCPNGQTNQEHQGQTHILAKVLKFLACWDCGPVGATIGIVGFATTTVLAYYGLKLAIWTATKDYIEHCQADLNIGVMSEACQNAAHQQLPPPPFYGFHNLSNPALFKRNTWSGMLVVTTGSHLHNNNYVWTYAALMNLPCWIVLHSLWKIITRSTLWSSQHAPSRFWGDREVRCWNSDTESLLYPMETPKELQARRIANWLEIQDANGPRPHLRSRRQGAASQSDSSRVTWQERLEERCREAQIHPPVFQIISDRRGGRTAWSSTVTVMGHNLCARYWYDSKSINNAKEDAAEVALIYLAGVKMDY